MNRTSLTTSATLIVGGLAIGAFLTSTGAFNWGQVLCWIAFVSAVTAGFSWWLCILGNDRAEPVARGAYRVQWLALLGGAAFLWWILFRHRFDFQYVHDYSSQDMPWYYVFAAFWGGQEGTFLLWAFLSTTLGLFLMYSRHSLARTAMFFSNLPMIMLTFIGAVRGPFLASKEAYTNGVGLNPLLQDWWMTIHPPVLFIGFSSFLFPFAIACAALLRRDYDGWVKPVMPWAVFATAVQATGFIMGGVWAYKVLGWGGYWGWDPVENGSLIPWLATVGLVHGLLVQRRAQEERILAAAGVGVGHQRGQGLSMGIDCNEAGHKGVDRHRCDLRYQRARLFQRSVDRAGNLRQQPVDLKLGCPWLACLYIVEGALSDPVDAASAAVIEQHPRR